MPVYVVPPPQFGRPSSKPGSSGRRSGADSGVSHIDNNPFDGYGQSQDSASSRLARENREYERGVKQYAAEYYECQDKVIKGELPVNTSCHGRTTRQILNDRINNNNRKLSYYNSPKFAGERNLKKLISTKRRLLLKGAKPKSTLSPLGRTLRYKSNAPFVDWSKWAKEIRDPRQPLFGEKKEFPTPTDENINNVETYIGADGYVALNNFNKKITKGGRRTRKNRR